MKSYYVYILASRSGTLYVGVTSNLERRIQEHKLGIHDGFTKKYGCNKLVYFEETNDINSAIEREKQIKNWNRHKKEFLIRRINRTWRDLSIERDPSTSFGMTKGDPKTSSG